MITPEEDQPLTFRACLAALLQQPADKIDMRRNTFLYMCVKAKTNKEDELRTYFMFFPEDHPDERKRKQGWEQRKREREWERLGSRLAPGPQPPQPPPAKPRKPLGKQHLPQLRLFTALSPEEFRAPNP